MTDYADLRRLAEQATPGPWTTDAADGMGGAYIAAANPRAILALLDERDGVVRAYREVSHRILAAERRVAALEEGLRRIVALDYRGPEPEWWSIARALLDPATPPADYRKGSRSVTGSPGVEPAVGTGINMGRARSVSEASDER